MPTISTLLTLPVSWVTTAKGVGFIILHNGLGKLDACKVNFTFVVDFLYAFMLGIVIQGWALFVNMVVGWLEVGSCCCKNGTTKKRIIIKFTRTRSVLLLLRTYCTIFCTFNERRVVVNKCQMKIDRLSHH